jgi:hypothetical protein
MTPPEAEAADADKLKALEGFLNLREQQALDKDVKEALWFLDDFLDNKEDESR